MDEEGDHAGDGCCGPLSRIHYQLRSEDVDMTE